MNNINRSVIINFNYYVKDIPKVMRQPHEEIVL